MAVVVAGPATLLRSAGGGRVLLQVVLELAGVLDLLKTSRCVHVKE